MARIVLTTFGSLGDLHPFLALALGLRARGHQPVLATSAMYRDKIEAEGVAFAPVRPDLTDFEALPELMKSVSHQRRGPEFVIRHMMMPWLRASFDDLAAAAEGADLLLTHTLTFAGPVLAELRALPHVAVALQPTVFFSRHDPPVLAPAPGLAALRRLGPALYGPLFRLVRQVSDGWTRPVRALRTELGLPPPAGNPLFEGQFSRRANLALFSPHFAAPQPDWPPRTVATGFAHFDRLGREQGLADDLAAFLAAGPPPVVFTLGSSAVLDAGGFYHESAAACARLGCRGVLLVGEDPRNLPAEPARADLHYAPYAPYGALFPRAAAIVHSAGIGTCGQALRAGKPLLTMPFSHDQPDNADRLRRLGVACVIGRRAYGAARVARELERLLTDPSYAARAAELGAKISGEDGVARACDVLEEALSRP